MRQRCGVTGNFGSTSRKLQAIAAASPSETGERGRLRFAMARAAAPLPFFVASCGKVSLARRTSEAKVKDLFGVALIFQKRSVVCAPFFCLRLIAEKQTCFCGLKIVILPFCPKACGSLLPTAFLTCAKKRVISENCPYSIVDVSASGCDKYVRILVRLLFQRLKRLGYVRLFAGFVPYVVVAINFEVVFVLLFFSLRLSFFYP